jgi:hypothetical protein
MTMVTDKITINGNDDYDNNGIEINWDKDDNDNENGSDENDNLV